MAGKVLSCDGDQWEQVIFEGIKETDNPYYPREIGAELWPNKHSLERILAIKDNSPLTFNSLYQQTPRPLEGLIVWAINISVGLEMPILNSLAHGALGKRDQVYVMKVLIYF